MQRNAEIAEAPLRLIANQERQIRLLEAETERLRNRLALLDLQLQSDREEEHF